MIATFSRHKQQQQQKFFRSYFACHCHYLLTTSSSSSSSTQRRRHSNNVVVGVDRHIEAIWNDVLNTRIFSNTTNNSNVTNNNKRTVFDILELGCGGSGIHMNYICQKLHDERDISNFRYYPTDSNPRAIESLKEIIQEAKVESQCIQEPRQLTLLADEPTGVVEPTYFPKYFDLMININMIHSSPSSATYGLMKFAKHRLRSSEGKLHIYGPLHLLHLSRTYRLQKQQQQDGNTTKHLPVVRNLEDVIKLARDIGSLELIDTIPMPNNNTSIIFRRLQRND